MIGLPNTDGLNNPADVIGIPDFAQHGHSQAVGYRSSLMKYSGIFHLGVHKATLQTAGARAGSTV